MLVLVQDFTQEINDLSSTRYINKVKLLIITLSRLARTLFFPYFARAAWSIHRQTLRWADKWVKSRYNISTRLHQICHLKRGEKRDNKLYEAIMTAMHAQDKETSQNIYYGGYGEWKPFAGEVSFPLVRPERFNIPSVISLELWWTIIPASIHLLSL